MHEPQMRSFERQSKHFFWETGDGSLTASEGLSGEWMHHRAGALGETRHVYAPAIRLAFDLVPHPRLLSIGVGLAYVEWVAFAEAIQRGRPLEIASYESEADLREPLRRFLEGGPGGIFSQTLGAVAVGYGIPSERLLEVARVAFADGRWSIEGAWGEPNSSRGPFHGISFDAFSAKTTPTLWNRSVLTAIFRDCADDPCVFASYAATGALKRTLVAHRFENQKRSGFAGKRECTLAVRGGGGLLAASADSSF